jgi:hypothetical protein
VIYSNIPFSSLNSIARKQLVDSRLPRVAVFIVKAGIETLMKRHRKVLIKLFQKFVVRRRRNGGRSSQRAKSPKRRFSFVNFSFGWSRSAPSGRRSDCDQRKKQGVSGARHAFAIETTMFLTEPFCVKRKSG